MIDVLKLLEQDARLTPQDLAKATGRTVDEVNTIIRQATDDGILLGYRALVNWDKVGVEECWALIGVKASPQRDVGFDLIAERIGRFPETHSVYLVTGDWDLMVLVMGKTMREVADFVSRRLYSLEGVTGTGSLFIMRRYKDQGKMLEGEVVNPRLAITP